MNLNNCENIPNVYNNNQFNQNYQNTNMENKNKVSFFNIKKQINQIELAKNNINLILNNQNFFPSNKKNQGGFSENNEQNNPFNINFETIASNDLKRKEGNINQYIGEIFDGGYSYSEWTNNNNIFNQV